MTSASLFYRIIANLCTPKASKSQQQPKAPRERRERGPPADGIPSKNKVMVANLPYDLTEEKVRDPRIDDTSWTLTP